MIYNDSKTRTKNRKKIVNVATKLFIENGIAHTTIMDIVREVEIERKTFYNYFESKEEIADYIYFNSMKFFYSKGFQAEDYEDCNNGYEKVKKYFLNVVNAFVTYKEEMLYLVHYDYYYKKEKEAKVIEILYKEYNILSPYELFLEGVKDGSINIEGEDPHAIFGMISQSIGSYASRLILRHYRESNLESENSFNMLYKLLDVHLGKLKSA